MVMGTNNLDKKIGLKIKLERTKRGWSQEKLAELSALSKNSIGIIERGESSPSITTLEKIALAFGIPLPDLVDTAKFEL